MTTQPGDYMPLYEVTQTVYPPLVVEEGGMLAEKLREKVDTAARARGVRSNFGALSALEAVHKLALHVNALPPHEREKVLAWLAGGAS